jgi:addiction module RelE/StbE family toxin
LNESHEVELSDLFLQQLKKLDPHQRKLVMKRIEKIAQQPLLGKPLTGGWKGYFSERLEHYRIIYKIVNDRVVLTEIGDRKNVYS